MSIKKVAIVGGGVSGLSCAWHLHANSPNTEVHIFEAEDRLGGHAHTISVTPKNSDPIDVDVGFMVFNDSNYPNMVSWFKEMGVEMEDTDMSLSVSLDQGNMEWSSVGLAGLLANKSQIFRPSFHRFVKDMMRFNKEAGKILTLPLDDPRRQITTKQYLREEGYSEEFATHYLLPMMAALWSASMGDVLNFPAVQLIGFLCNHKMLQIFDRPQVSFCGGFGGGLDWNCVYIIIFIEMFEWMALILSLTHSLTFFRITTTFFLHRNYTYTTIITICSGKLCLEDPSSTPKRCSPSSEIMHTYLRPLPL
jgi:predicted NAD/FAD-binding protein